MITAVRVEGVALLKIIQHCTTNLPHLVTGQILGFDKPDGSLEVRRKKKKKKKKKVK